MNKKGLSAIRASLEFILLFIGLIAGALLIFALFVDISNGVLDSSKAIETLNSLKNFEMPSIHLTILALLFLFLTIRFFIVFRKAKQENYLQQRIK